MRLIKTSSFRMPLYMLVLFISIFRTVYAENAGRADSENIAEALFTTGIKDREPVDHVLVLTNDIQKVYFYSDIRHLSGKTIVHRWEYEGNMVSEKKFDVGGPRWRVYSQKILNPNMTGTWTVTVQDGNGWPIYVDQFKYVSVGDASKAILPRGE